MAATPSGKDKVLRYTRLWVGGYDLSGDSRTFGSAQNTFDDVDLTGWSDSTYQQQADRRMVGLRGYQALLNDAAGGAFTRLKDQDQQSHLILAFGGGGEPDVPDPAYLLPVVQMGGGVGLDGKAPAIRVDWSANAATVDANTGNPLGVILANADLTATTNGASHNNGASTANGWHAVLQVTATASGNYSFVIEHGTNDSVWATLGTFTADGSAITSEYLTGSGTVNQYVRLVSTRTAGTCSIAVAFARA